MRFVRSGDRGLLVLFEGETASGAIQACAARLLARRGEGLVAVHPGDGSLLVAFDPLRSTHDAIRAAVEAASLDATFDPAAGRTVEIPVCYEGAFAPDLDAVARHAGLSASEAVEAHARAAYRVAFLGFVPGFAYLEGLPDRLAIPRRPEPRRRVPPGSVAIGGSRTAVYPFATPGGWHLIGRTPRTMFDPGRDPMALLAPGDRVRFVPIPASRFEDPTW